MKGDTTEPGSGVQTLPRNILPPFPEQKFCKTTLGYRNPQYKFSVLCNGTTGEGGRAGNAAVLGGTAQEMSKWKEN